MTARLSLSQDLSSVRLERPLILNVTNHVAMDFSANALLALGASPIMALDRAEMDELVSAAASVVINMGTLNPCWLEAAKEAWRAANEKGKPVVFDPVGAGATRLRTSTAQMLLKEFRADIVRGNASEILALLTEAQTGKGVDSGSDPTSVLHQVRSRISDGQTTFVISGATDCVVSERSAFSIRNGHPQMAKVTAMGCVATCMIAAFRTVEPDPVLASLKGMAMMGICGELATARASGPGSLRQTFLDLLAQDDLPFDERVQVGAA